MIDRARMTNLNDFVEAYAPLFDTKTMTLNSSNLKANSDSDRSLEIDRHTLSGDLYYDFLRSLHVPTTYAEKVPTELLIPHLKYFIGMKSEPVVCEISKADDRTIRSFGENKNKMDLATVASEFRNITKSELLSGNSFIKNRRVVMYGITSEIAKEPRKGDIVEGGLYFDFDKRYEKVNASVYTNRLVCSNGAIATSSHLKWKKGNQQIPEFLSKIKKEYENHCNVSLILLENLDKMEVGDLTCLENLLNEYTNHIFIPDKIVGNIKIKVLAHTISNMYDIWNIITEEVTHGTYENEARLNLLKYCGVAAELSATGKSHCSYCGKSLIN
jgi:hypothetical protein